MKRTWIQASILPIMLSSTAILGLILPSMQQINRKAGVGSRGVLTRVKSLEAVVS
ncbi:hypothetical protein BDD12DRAFT_821087 [Trichophaea hybrida]|nr:hypothetical protein BDD12DRAFT_821087 [Trichophaea hybrida]